MDDLVKKVIGGEKGAATEFYKRYAPVVRRYLRERLPCGGDAEETLQDIFLAAFESLPLYKGESQIKTWLMAIAHHETADFYRRKFCKKALQITTKLSENATCEITTPEYIFVHKQINEKIDGAMGKIREQYRQILMLRYETGMSVREISQKLCLNFKATESLLYRARLAFIKTYEGI